MLDITPMAIDDVLMLQPRRFQDDRGFFCESWNRDRLKQAGVDIDFVQDNYSFSRDRGTVRGLHFQAPPHAQVKLVRCGRGRIYDVVVDIRKGSPSFGQWVGEELSFDNGKQLLIPEGFLHGFITLEDDSEVIYKCSDYYAPQCEGVVRFDDPDLGVVWPDYGLETGVAIAMSDKDRSAPLFRDFQTPFT